MKKILSFILCFLMVVCPISGTFTVLATETNLLENISVSDFGSNDETPPRADFGFEQYTDSTYGKAFKVHYAWYTSFYIKLPALDTNTKYNLSFKYDNAIGGQVGSIQKIDLLTEEEIALVNENGYPATGTGTRLGTSLALDKSEWTAFDASFTTKSESTNYYINVTTNYAFTLMLCDFSLVNGDIYSVTVSGGTADKARAKVGDTVTVTADTVEGKSFLGWIASSGNVNLADSTATTTTFTMPEGNVVIQAKFGFDGDLDSVPMPNLLADISTADFGSKDQTPTTTDFGFTAMTDGKYSTKYRIRDSYYTTFYVSLPELKPNTEYYIGFRYDNDIQVVTPGNIERIHILNEDQLANVDANGKVTDTSITPIGKNIPLDKGEWSLFSAYFTTGSEATNYYINIKTGYCYNLYLCDFVLKETVERPVVVDGGTASKETAKIGEEITITASPTAAQKFMGWSNLYGDAVLGDTSATTTTFLMPDSAVSLKAEYYENLWNNIDTSYLGTNDQSPNSGFGFAVYQDGNYGTAFNVKMAYYTTLFVKLPKLEANEEYNISFKYDNVISTTAGEILKVDLLTEEEIATADANGAVKSNVGTRLGTNLKLDKGRWSTLGYTFTTAENDTSYYLNIQTQYAYWLRLCDFKITKNFAKGMTVTNGSSDNPFALEGERVKLYADTVENKTFNYWKVLSGGITVENPYSETASFTMGNMAAEIEAVYLNDGEVKTIYTSLDGTDLANAISSVHSSAVTDNSDGTATAKIDLYTFNGAYAFNGWFNGDERISTATEYTFNTGEINLSDLTARVLVLNTIDGDPGFENYSTGDTVRVSPANSGVLPHNDKWGIWNRYNSASNGFEAGYENLDWGYIIEAFNGTTTDYYKNYTYSPETATYSVESTKNAYTVTPYSGNSMIGFAVKSRSAVRKLQNLQPNTEYQISFYVNNPSKTDFLDKIVVANTYDLDAGNVDKSDERVYAYFEDYDGYADYNKLRTWGRMTINFTTPADATDAYLHFAFSTTNSHVKESKVFIDNLICVPTVVSYAGNAIRKTSADTPQALRYKFSVKNELLIGFNGMQVSEIGILAMENDVLGGKELVLNGKYGAENKAPRKGIVNQNNIQSVEGDDLNSYFTAALYNIGKTNGEIDYEKYSSDYTVRPYFKLIGDDGEEIVLYSSAIDASVFAVVHEIYSGKNNADDRAAADEVLATSAAYNAFAEFEPKDEFFIMKEPVTDYAFSIAVVGDPQKTTYFHPEDLHYTYDWIVANAEKNNTQYVITLGDITEYHNDFEYELISGELEKIKNAGLPQMIVRGNHDTVASFDTYITKEKFGEDLTGSYDDTMKNVYQILKMGGQKYLIMTIDYYDQLTTDMVDWAAGIVAENPDCRVILNTHGYLNTTMGTTNNKMVKYFETNLIKKYENIDLVLCGHDIPYGDDGPVYRTVTGDNGNKIIEMMINPQTLEEQKREAFGLVSTLYFGNDGKTVTVEWYSSVRQAYYMDKFQFTFELS